jgi:YidC/Oxa1 family membrane protein insertase
MFNPRYIFLLISLSLVMLLVFDWGNISKEQKVEVSKFVQEKTDSDLLRISNESLEIFVDLEDGSIKEAYLKEKKINNDLEKVRLLSNDEFLRFYFKSTISGFNPTGFSVLNSSNNYLTIQAMDGVGNVLTKKITFSNKYNLLIEDRLDLSTSTIGVINSFKTFYRDEKKSVDYGTSFSRDHLAFSTSEDVFNDESLGSVDNREDYIGHWVGHSQKHFVVAVYDDVNQQKISLYPKDINGMYRFGTSEPMNFEGGSYVSQTKLYLGPKQKDILEAVAPHFKYNLDLGFVYGIGEFFIVVLNFLYGLVNNWGVSIILLTVLFKVVLSPLQVMQLNSMVKMRKLSPKLQELQEKYKNDRNKLSMEMMQLYKREKFNPAAGCLPLFAQFPIFIAMFWVTREAFEFRGESFLWIPDLAESDPYLIAPVLMGLMMFASQKLMPKPPQSQGMQAQIAQQMMVIFPPMITIVFLFMPAGVVVYSVVNMLLSIIPQVLIMSRVQSESG